MENLDKNYKEELDRIKVMIQESDTLGLYLENEDEESYRQLVSSYEPSIDQLYNIVADKHPLQLISFEKELLDPEFEGLFLPRVLGYSVLRGQLNDRFKYDFSQDHFRDILFAITESPNYDYIESRIGQTVSIGFALSTDIWVTDLIDKIQNKNVSRFLHGQKISRFREIYDRKIAYNKYKQQFEKFNYQTAVFPKTVAELKTHGDSLQEFLLYRAATDFDNNSLLTHINTMLKNKEFLFEPEFIRLTLVLGMYFELDDKNSNILTRVFNQLRKEREDFDTDFFDYYLQFVDDRANFKIDAVANLSKIIDKSIEDELTVFFRLMDIVYDKGYLSAETIEAVRSYYNEREWLSNQNRCLRHSLNNRFSKLINNLSEKDYHEFFDMFKTFAVYMDIFSNEKFNQNIKLVSMAFVKKLIAHYTDKRSKEYQEIKKFVMSSFVDLKFYKEKELIELFKSKRKKKISK